MQTVNDMTDDKMLRIYLNDHLAGLVAGIELARRNESRNRNSALGSYVAELLPELLEQKAAITQVLAKLGGRVARLKAGFGWFAEKLGRLKLNGRLTQYSHLSRLEEIEGMCLEAAWRELMWESLAETRSSDPRLSAFDFRRLAESARTQREQLAKHRVDAARAALSRRP
jgi:hypothetical protein